MKARFTDSIDQATENASPYNSLPEGLVAGTSPYSWP
jgi:hypothetical protein